MTAFETASLALCEWALWVAVAEVAATVLVGAAQVAIVAHGIRVMQVASDKRAQEQDRRHVEAMAALNARNEVLRTQSEALRTRGEALRTQSEALRVLIERTEPRRS